MHICYKHDLCVENALKQAEMVCENKGIRFTEIRKKILAMVWQNHGAAKAYDILDKLRQKDISTKPPTVYRALDFLMEHNLIHKLNSLNAYVGCSHPLEPCACYFLICYICGHVHECCNETITSAILETTHHYQFKAKHVTLEIEGKCQQCAQEN